MYAAGLRGSVSLVRGRLCRGIQGVMQNDLHMENPEDSTVVRMTKTERACVV
jgi:hypothetical protein